MRIISQDKLADASYERIAIKLYDLDEKGTTIDAFGPSFSVELGLYSTKEKALKVMGMIKEQYETNVIAKSRAISNFTSTIIMHEDGSRVYQYKEYFYMPLDWEV